MRVVTWNMGIASPRVPSEKYEEAWDYLLGLEPDLAFVQEAVIPDSVRASFAVEWAPAYGTRQWGTGIICRGTISDKLDVARLEPGVSRAFEELPGLVMGAKVATETGQRLTAVSVHAPARTVGKEVFTPNLLDTIKLKLNKDVWYADVVFGAVRMLPSNTVPFVVGGDWNLARLFDEVYWPRGNVEFFERMEAAGLIDCVNEIHGKEVRTWFREGDAPYQLDHIFCDAGMRAGLRSCYVDPLPAEQLGLSDHAPIITDWDPVA